MDSNAPVFDGTVPVAIQLRTPDGTKTVRVRFPNDDDWAERQRRRKVVIKQLGRGRSETLIPNAEDVDAALLAKIRTEEDAPVDVDPFEAARCIEQLSHAEVDDAVSVGDNIRVVTNVLGATTVHLLRMPSAKDVFEYRRCFARVVDLPYNRQELTINLRAAGDLYKRLVQATEGYVGAVPIIHQAVAVKAAIDALDNLAQEDRESSF
jgi:hypothetical protein